MAPAQPAFYTETAALGRTLQARWDAVHRDEKAFAGIAHETLGAYDPPPFHLEEVGPFLVDNTVAQFADGGRTFSDMPVTVHRGEGFYIEVLVWMDGTTAIHHHGFSGAFRLLEGSSLHSVYRFDETHRINARTRIGRISCTSMRCLRTGDCHPIASGPDGLAHSLFHLERPSVTLVARTNTDPDSGPQHSLFPPALALDPVAPDRLEGPLRRWLEVLAKTGAGQRMNAVVVERLFELDFGRFARFLLAYPEMASLFERRTPWEAMLRSPGRWQRRVTERFGAKLARVLFDAGAEAQRCEMLRRMRADVSDPDLRFFLALLLNGRSREQVFTAVQDREPEQDPAAFCARALRDLAALGAEEANGALAARAPWVRTLDEAIAAGGEEVAERLAAGRYRSTETAGAGTAEKAAAALARIPALRALAD